MNFNISKTAKLLIGVITCLQLIHLILGHRFDFVTCGSVIKLENTNSKGRLHSHEVQYGSGSGQQSVTTIENTDDVNSHWVVKGVAGKTCQRGEAIKCGDNVRLEHLITKRNLHSHLFPAPLSRGQEVSAFGKEGEGDTGDYWNVVCEGDKWKRNSEIMFRHLDTSMYLAVSGNVFGHPIPGQMEVYGINRPEGASVYWKVQEGIFVKPSEINIHKNHVHTEL